MGIHQMMSRGSGWQYESKEQYFEADPTIEMPSGTREGDLLILIASSVTSYTAGLTGWTEIPITSTYAKPIIYWKVAGASESSLTLTGGSSISPKTHGVLLRYSGLSAAPYDSTSTEKTAASSASITLNTLTTTVINELCILVAFSDASTVLGGSVSINIGTQRHNIGYDYNSRRSFAVNDYNRVNIGGVTGIADVSSTAGSVGISFSFLPA